MPANRKKRAKTRAQRWKKPDERTVEITLPSGNEAVIRMMTLDEMIVEGGSLLAVHSAVVMRLLKTFDKGMPQSTESIQPDELEAEQAAFLFGCVGDIQTLAGPVCRMAFVSPRIVEADPRPEEDEITLDELTQADRLFVFGRVTGVGEEMLSFFPPPDGGGDAGPGGDEVRDEAEPDPAG
jgi:hypothetical protein